MSELAYWEARARALFRALDADPDVVMLGGLVSLPFNPDDGLLARYGDRVLWPPISEFATAALAVGAAIDGLRPLVAVGTSSFVFHAWPALVNEAPNVRYLSGGEVTAPVVFHMMGGSRRHGGAQHEHTPQSMLQNVPGMRVYAPGTPADIDAAFHAALTGEDPTVIVDHVLLAEARGAVPDEPAELTPTELLVDAPDVLLVASSLMTQRCLEAAQTLHDEGVGAAVLNVRVIAPSPAEQVVAAARRHSRIVFVDESRGPGSPASHLMARIAEALPGRMLRLVCTRDAPAPFAAELLDEVVPTTARIVEAARDCVGRPRSE